MFLSNPATQVSGINVEGKMERLQNSDVIDYSTKIVSSRHNRSHLCVNLESLWQLPYNLHKFNPDKVLAVRRGNGH